MGNPKVNLEFSVWVSIAFVLYVLLWPFRLIHRLSDKYIAKLDIVAHIREYRRIKALNKRLETVESYQEWYQTAYELDQLTSNFFWETLVKTALENES